MGRTFHTDLGHLEAALVPKPVAVRAQVASLLASPHFRNSKRSQALLRFVVDAALAGDPNSLKERCIGAAVFGREAAYDTAQDPIVRNAAIEVRKRLAQYYMEPEHAHELRIDLPIGSYLPTFTAEASPVVVEMREPAAKEPSRRLKRVAAVATVILAAGAAFLWSARRTAATELESFWEPLFRDRNPIQICIGQPTRLYRFTGPRMEELNRLLATPPSPDRNSANVAIGPGEVNWVAPEYLYLRDALAAFKVGSWIQSKGVAYQLMSVAQTNYSRLRREPMVAIGAFNNPWSIRVTSELRFVFERRTIDGISYNCIIDRRNPESVNWKVAQPVGSMTEDYAIATRVFDPATEKTVISAAGIETFGTLAASEFVTAPEYLGTVLQAAAKDWRRKNVQFVLGTKIIDGTPGPPRVLAVHYW
jgi:hypothetical protein